MTPVLDDAARVCWYTVLKETREEPTDPSSIVIITEKC